MMWMPNYWYYPQMMPHSFIPSESQPKLEDIPPVKLE